MKETDKWEELLSTTADDFSDPEDPEDPEDREDPEDQETIDLPIGASIGRYVILSELGRGGMGVVYKAYDPELDRRIALKLMLVKSAPNGGNIASGRLLREAQALAQLSHPNVVSVHDVGALSQAVFIAMEFVEGSTLRQWLEQGSKSISECLEVLIEAGQGLSAAHLAGIIHRDFKPENVIIGVDGRARVLDFGLARAAMPESASQVPRLTDSQEQSDVAESAGFDLSSLKSLGTDLSTGGSSESILCSPITQVGAVMGTPAYMAPEQHLGQAVDARSDQYSFCVVVYETLYGQRPFAGKRYKTFAKNVLQGKVRQNPGDSRVPAWLRKILLRGMATEPADRFASMDDLLEALLDDPIAARQAQKVARMRTLSGVFVGVLVALVSFLIFWAFQPDLKLCQGASSKLSTVWNDNRLQQIHNAFLATNKSFAQDAFDRVAQQMNQYTQAWVGMHTQACEATHIKGEQSFELLDRRMICLGQRLKQVEALSDVFIKADAQVVTQAIQAAHGLSSLSACANAHALSARIKPPADDATRQEAEKIWSMLGRAKALHDTGRYMQAMAGANQMVASAKALGYKPLYAEALYWLGRLQERSGHYQDAVETLYDAFWTADGAAYDEIRSRSATYLVFLVGYHMVDPVQAKRWAKHSKAAIDRLGGSVELEASRLGNLGVIVHLAGDKQKGFELIEQSMEKIIAAFGPDHPNVGTALNSISSIHSSMKNWSKAIEYNQRALALRVKILGKDHPKVAHSLSNYAATLAHTGDLDKALELGLRSIQVFRQSMGPDHPVLLLSLNTLGQIYYEKKQYPQAAQHLQNALRICNKTECNPELHNVARFTLAQSLWFSAPDKAVALAKKALGATAKHDLLKEVAQGIKKWLAAHDNPKSFECEQ